MKRDEFMKELEYLLQDIPDEDKGDAIAYYQDYLDEAGPEKEEEVLQSFGSPERVAAIIRSELSGDLEEGGAFTENGYEDERFREPNYQLAERLETPACREEEDRGEKDPAAGAAYGKAYGKENRPKPGRQRGEWWQVAGALLLACCALPIILPLVLGIGGGAIGLIVGIGGGAVGLLALVGGILISVTIALAAVTFALLLGGVVLLFFGLGRMADPVQGILYIGTGIGVLGLGFLCLALCGLYYGKFLPWLGVALINLVSRLVHRKGKKKRETVY